MGKKGKGRKTRKGRPGNFTSLGGHRKIGKTLHTTWTSTLAVTPSSWTNDRLPEMVWAALLLSERSRTSALAAIRRAMNSVVEGFKTSKTKADVTLSGISLWPDQGKRAFLAALTEDVQDAFALRPLLVFEALPGRPSWEERLGGVPPDDAWERLAKAVATTLWHQSDEATDCRWARYVFQVLIGRTHFLPGQEEEARMCLGYPDYGDPHRIRPSMRASELMVDRMVEPRATGWSEAFWKTCMEQTRCIKYERPHGPPPAYGVNAENVVAAFIALKERWSETARTTGIDPKHDGVFGMALYDGGLR